MSTLRFNPPNNPFHALDNCGSFKQNSFINQSPRITFFHVSSAAVRGVAGGGWAGWPRPFPPAHQEKAPRDTPLPATLRRPKSRDICQAVALFGRADDETVAVWKFCLVR